MAQYLGDNFQKELQIPKKKDKIQWSTQELNNIFLQKSSIKHDENNQLHSIADSRPDNGTGSRLYELNVWLWNYRRSLPWPISVEEPETDKILQKRIS